MTDIAWRFKKGAKRPKRCGFVFDTGVASVAFSETSLSGYSLLGAIERGTEGVSYLHVWYGIEKGKPQKIGKEIASQSDQVYCTYWHIK